MAHETIKIVLDASYPYDDFQGWYDGLEEHEREVWLHLAKDSNRSENNIELLTKKALELYCLEMDVTELPNSEEFVEKIYRRLIGNLVIASLINKGLAYVGSGKLSFLGDADIQITEKGKNYLKEHKQ